MGARWRSLHPGLRAGIVGTLAVIVLFNVVHTARNAWIIHGNSDPAVPGVGIHTDTKPATPTATRTVTESPADTAKTAAVEQQAQATQVTNQMRDNHQQRVAEMRAEHDSFVTSLGSPDDSPGLPSIDELAERAHALLNE